jgi:hypothetical protein
MKQREGRKLRDPEVRGGPQHHAPPRSAFYGEAMQGQRAAAQSEECPRTLAGLSLHIWLARIFTDTLRPYVHNTFGVPSV